jgi:hypothetical protein
MDLGEMQKMTLYGALLAAFFLATLPARAEIKLDPGTWQQVESGTENGEPAKPVTYTDCLTPEEARDPVKSISNLKDMGELIGKRCKELQVHRDADTISVDFSCGDEKTTFIGINLAFKFIDARHYSGRVKSTFVFKGKKTATDKTIQATWLNGECKKERE